MRNVPVALDARDAFVAPLRGWGRYALELARHLPQDLVEVYRDGGPGPEILWEQVGLPLRAWRRHARVLHQPNCFLPVVRRCAGVVTVHDLAFEAHPDDFTPRTGAKYRLVTPRAVRSAQRVICVSRATADDVVARYGVDERALRVIANAPSLAIGDAPAGDGRRGPYLLAVGDLRAKKNLGRLVEAFDALRRDGELDGHTLVLAGHGTLPGGVPPGVEVTGFLDDARLDSLMRGAALLVHPSLYEGFGLVVAEAMARGIPVACADATALPETAGGAAELFDPHDVDALAAAILRALGRAEELRAAGLARAADWSWARCARETADVYRELL